MSNQPDLRHLQASVFQSQGDVRDVRDELNTYKSCFNSLMLMGLPNGIPPHLNGNNPVELLSHLQQKHANGSIPSQNMQQMRSDARSAYGNITALEDKVSYIDTTLQTVKNELCSLDVWLKEWNILIHGLKDLPAAPTTRQERNSHEFRFIEHICAKLNELLGSELYRPLLPSDIERAHILYQGENNTNNPVVIMRFLKGN